MKLSAILTFTGQDRPDIVARATQILFENGCNIADSSMTRLGGEFTVMLILHLPAKMTTKALAQRFRPLAEEMALSVHIRNIPDVELGGLTTFFFGKLNCSMAILDIILYPEACLRHNGRRDRF